MGSLYQAIASGPIGIAAQNEAEQARAAALRSETSEAPSRIALRETQAAGVALENEKARIALDDQRIMGEAMRNWDGSDVQGLVKSVIKGGASPTAVFGLQNSILNQRKLTTQVGQEQLKLDADRHDRAAGMIDAFEQQPDAVKAAQYPSLVGQLGAQGFGDVARDLAGRYPQYPGGDQMKTYRNSLLLHSQINKEQIEANEAALRTQQQKEIEAKLPGEQAVSEQEQLTTKAMKDALSNPQAGVAAIDAAVPASVDEQANASFKASYRAKIAAGDMKGAAGVVEAAAAHAANLSPAVQANKVATAVKIEKAEMPGKIAQAQIIAAPGRAQQSYTFNQRELDAAAKPVTDTMSRIVNLEAELQHPTGMGDALAAPQLLSVMVGGQGSGLRMNQAEINRIVGGRGAWDALQARVNGLKAGETLGPVQRQQMANLTAALKARLMQKQAILTQANQDLVNSDDPMQHRRIVARVKQQLAAIDQGPAGAAVAAGVKVGDVVSVRGGRRVKVTAVHPDGTFDAE